MKTKAVHLFFIIAFFTIACNNNSVNQETEQQQAWDAVMGVHDEVMPKMAEVNRRSDELRTRAATMDSTQLEMKQFLLDAAQALERADEGMMEWMANVQAPETMRGENKTHAEIMRYLNEEKNKVDQVRDSIQLSLQRGEQLLQQTATAVPDTNGNQ